MEPEARYTIVGAGVLVLVALLVVAVLWLRSSGEGDDALVYTIYFERQSLQGLEPRSDVTMRGMRVGSVTTFRFSSRRPEAVEVVVAVDPTTPVRETTRATVERHLVTGLATVRLANPSETGPLLRAAPPGEPHPVIAEGQSSIQQVSESLTQLVGRVGVTLERVNSTLSADNQKALAEILDNLRRVSKQAETSLARADKALGSVGGAADDVRALALSVAADARTLSARYDALGTDASGSMRELGAAARRMGDDVERLAQRADALLAHGDDELRGTLQALRSAVDAVGAAAGHLRDPRQVIYGPADGALGPGEAPR